LKAFDKNPLLRGITFTGGEPLCRAGELLPLAREIKGRGRDIVIYTGYRFEELMEMCETDLILAELLKCADLLIDGPYLEALRDITLRFRGSMNQRVLDLPRSLAEEAPVWAEGYA
jgi:anaerobic ribonucleoside-triphosphate reductase activating protein